jgi:hypothetical protein
MSRRHKVQPPAPGIVEVPAAAVVCGGAGAHNRAGLFDLLDGRDLGLGDVVLWQGESPEKSFADDVPGYRFVCPRCGRDVPLRLPTLLAEISADREARSDRVRPVIDIARLRAVKP